MAGEHHKSQNPRAYKEDVREFIGFTGLHDYLGLRSVVRSHIIAWRKDMERLGLALAAITQPMTNTLVKTINLDHRLIAVAIS